MLFLLSVLMNEKNKGIPFSVVLAAPEERTDYFESFDRFVRATLGDEAAGFYQIVVGEPERTAQTVMKGIERVRKHRLKTQDAYGFNWDLHIERELQRPFLPTHESMANLVTIG